MNANNFFLSGTGSLTCWNINFPLSRISSLLIPGLLCQLTPCICQGQCYKVEIWPSTCSTHDQGFALFLCHWPPPDPFLTSPGTFRKLCLLGWGICVLGWQGTPRCPQGQGRLEGLQHGRADEFGFEGFQTCWILKGSSELTSCLILSRKSSLLLCRRIMKWMSGEAVSHRWPEW